jgi:hypothetical protein
MATSKKNIFKNGIWVKKWKFSSDKKPFDSKMTPPLYPIKNKIAKFALKDSRTGLHGKRLTNR